MDREEATSNHRRASNSFGQPGQSPEVSTTTPIGGCRQSPGGGCRQSPGGGCRQSQGGCPQNSPRCCHKRIHNSNSRIISAKTEFFSVSTQNETLF